MMIFKAHDKVKRTSAPNLHRTRSQDFRLESCRACLKIRSEDESGETSNDAKWKYFEVCVRKCQKHCTYLDSKWSVGGRVYFAACRCRSLFGSALGAGEQPHPTPFLYNTTHTQRQRQWHQKHRYDQEHGSLAERLADWHLIDILVTTSKGRNHQFTDVEGQCMCFCAYMCVSAHIWRWQDGESAVALFITEPWVIVLSCYADMAANGPHHVNQCGYNNFNHWSLSNRGQETITIA